ncbi:MAG TPA: CAP domain-containing protein, partial [Tepidisphaeraceae bacterium]|nr:CAP domain-containing protein [Tepidisphaeraceae bacterium]
MKKAGYSMQGRSTARFEKLEPRLLMSAAEPTVAEQYMLELINRARANPTAEANLYGIDLNEGLSAGTITPDAKQPLAFNPNLITAARDHDNWMVQSQTFSHYEETVDPGAQMQSAGYPFTGSYTWGQNIAYQGTTPSVPPVNPTVQKEEQDLFVDSTEPGRGHRLNILNGAYKEVGVGVVSGSFQGYNSVLVTQDFASESGGSFLTGVAYTDANHTHFYAPGEGL